ncbi:MAG TPA: OmpA family protein [Rhizomicrobium sp.]|nr:OmpA family protein [Rhizomicrobium sp.]
MLPLAPARPKKLLVPLLAVAVCACTQRPLETPLYPQTSVAAPRPTAKPVQQKPQAHAAAPFVPPVPTLVAPPLAVAHVGSYMDSLESDLRRHVHGNGITIARMGDDISVILRSDRLFAKDGALTADDILEPLGALLGTYVHTSIMVCGYTDTAGPADQNLALSQKRARAVADALVHEGVSAQRVSSQGFGETRLKVATGDDKKEARNRRIEILLKARPG